MQPKLEDAIALAAKYHGGQIDKAGDPYIIHLCRVMVQFTSPILQMAAVLHDIVEDTVITTATLIDLDYPQTVTKTVDVLTRRYNEDYEKYIERCRLHQLARKVKIADLKDHLIYASRGKLNCDQITRYMKAYQQLTGNWPYFWSGEE